MPSKLFDKLKNPFLNATAPLNDPNCFSQKEPQSIPTDCSSGDQSLLEMYRKSGLPESLKANVEDLD